MAYEVLDEAGIRKVLNWPHVDLDVVIALDPTTQKPTQIEVTGLGRTITKVITYPTNQIVIATVIT